MPLYEYINPSDPYTFEADNGAVASVAAWLVTPGGGAQRIDEEEDDGYGIALFGIPDQFTKDHGDVNDFAEANKEAIARALLSFWLGKPNDRKVLDRMREELDEEAFAKFQETWDDEQRSSLSEHGNRAHSLGKALMEAVEEAAAKGV